VGNRVYGFVRGWRIDSRAASVGRHRRSDPVAAGTKTDINYQDNVRALMPEQQFRKEKLPEGRKVGRLASGCRPFYRSNFIRKRL
jgi:hypothetical protein